MSKTGEFCIINEDFVFKNDEFCSPRPLALVFGHVSDLEIDLPKVSNATPGHVQELRA